jgi:murein DD-endopeptidase MepM/ murein hydrolase activator NlpD
MEIIFCMNRYNQSRKSTWFPGFCLWFMLFLFHPSTGCALTLALPDTAYQGDLIIGSIHPDARVRLKGQILPLGPEGHFVIAVPRNQKKDLRVTALHNSQKASHIIRIWAYPWQIQHVEGLPKRYVTPNADQQRCIREDARKIHTIRNSPSYPIPLFIRRGFVKPVTGRVTSPFGNLRILNGRPRNSHSGIDIAAPLGKPVHSPADGIVRLVAENLFLMGNTLLLDHGLGVSSTFIHLESIHVHVGDVVRQGDVIAGVGKTGRATGPHLHWGVHVGSIAVDPLRVLKYRF